MSIKNIFLAICDIIDAFISINGLQINEHIKICITLITHMIRYYDVFVGYATYIMYKRKIK